MIAALFLAVALAMDAFAVALTQGAKFRPGWLDGLKIAVAFGLAQGLMPLIGWALGDAVLHYIAAWDHWAAFALLSFLGLRMIFGHVEEEGEHRLTGRALLVAAIATSIDALAAGFTLPTLAINPYQAAALIALVTALLSALGVWLGQSLGERFGKAAEIAGGVILIALGLSILAENGVFS